MATKKKAPKVNRNRPGTGGVYRRADGRWEGKIDLGMVEARDRKTGALVFNGDGSVKFKRDRRSIYGDSEKEVLGELTKLSAQRHGIIDAPVAVDPSSSVETVLNAWVKTLAGGSVSPKTAETYAGSVKTHLIPMLGPIQADRLTPEHLSALYASMLGRGLSRATAHKTHVVARLAFSWAVKVGTMKSNPVLLVDPPKVERQPRATFDAKQIERFLETAKKDRLHALYVLALSTGMRRGEILGLRWQQVDLDNGTLQVVASASRTKQTGMVTKATKTPRSRRSITLTPQAVRALKAHKIRQDAERDKAGNSWVELGLVFTNGRGNYIEGSNLIKRSFKPLLVKAGLPDSRFQDMRHSVATLLLGAKVPTKIVSELLGHQSEVITMTIYQHVMPSMHDSAISTLAGILPTDDDDEVVEEEESA